ncbi:pyridoxal phosphate-dependent aminotransferase [Aestuariibacter salexigens]|uniref:pyridoxal phosphate-dependent aminotransferase n=1 Tax=Aestuariibacter salexigens TaxID=226010 RepID=UPI0004010A40|nr:aminotransferase class I/II-fold pyridoxal phosphate-dependent enzyme [Aestuariibacter salexigens]
MLTKRQFLSLSSRAVCLAIASSHLGISSALASTERLRQSQRALQLHFNENALGMSPQAMQAAINATRSSGNRYADPLLDILREQLATKHGVKGEQLIFGNGSTEVIQAVSRYAALNNATVVEPSPTFGALAGNAGSQGVRVIKVPVTNDFMTDLSALENAANQVGGAVVINICNPNNPTGTIVDSEALTAWIKRAPSSHLFLVDEAYYDYAQYSNGYSSMLGLVLDGAENVVIARTFSKVYGMAGLRVGYGIARKNLASKLNTLGADFNLNAAGIAAASASLQDDAFYQHSIKSNQQAKQHLLATLKTLELEWIPSHTNFVLHKINSPLDKYTQRMRQNGVMVGRRMTEEDGWNRISIGTLDDMREFSQLLLEFRERGWV